MNTMQETRAWLESIGQPGGDLYSLPTSEKRFDDGCQYRFEVPGIQGPTVMKALLAAIPVPDLDMRHKEIEVIKGELTSPINPKPGCRFAARCKYATEACTGQDPVLKDLGGNHFCACVRV